MNQLRLHATPLAVTAKWRGPLSSVCHYRNWVFLDACK